MKKIALLMLGLFSATAYANHETHPWTGFYQSGALGATLGEFDVDQQFNFVIPGAITISRPSELNLQSSNVDAFIGMGYSHQVNTHFLFGFELNAGITNISNTHNNELIVPNTGGPGIGLFINGTIRSSLKNYFSMVFKPGVFLDTNTQIYGLIGPKLAYFESTMSSITSFSGITTTGEDTVSGYELGITGGLGVERRIQDHLTLGLEYAYSYYGSIDSLKTSFDFFLGPPPPATVVDSSDITAQSNSLFLKLNYRF